MKDIHYYLKQHYNIEIKSYPNNMYCAEIKEIPGLCAYSDSEKGALEELEQVKISAFKLMIEQNNEIPLPSIRFEIPIIDYEQFSFKTELEKYAVV